MKKIVICIVAALLCATAQSRTAQSTDLRGDAIAIWEKAVSMRGTAPELPPVDPVKLGIAPDNHPRKHTGFWKDTKPTHKSGYMPYFLISSESNKRMSSEELEKEVLCRTDDAAMSNVMEIIKTYDVIKHAHQAKHEFVVLSGVQQDGKNIEVSILTSPHLPDSTRHEEMDYKNLSVIGISSETFVSVANCE